MSNKESNHALYESLECLIADGQRPFLRLAPGTADVGGTPGNRLIGAWCFLDHAGPSVFSVGSHGLRVGPHPHTSLQTFTGMLAGQVLILFEGATAAAISRGADVVSTARNAAAALAEMAR